MRKALAFVIAMTFILTAACAKNAADGPAASQPVVKHAAADHPAADRPAEATPAAKSGGSASSDHLTGEDKRLADKLNQVVKDYDNLHDEMAALQARLFLTPDLAEVYDIAPAPQTVNGWYVIDQIPTIRLKGDEQAVAVRFMATVSDRHMAPAVLGTDQDSSDGWSYHGPLIGEGKTIVWAEAMDAHGEVRQSPVIPVLSHVAEDATATKPAELFQNIADPEAVVEKYYELTSVGDYSSAWDLIHSSERDFPPSGARNVLRQKFLAMQGTKGPGLDKIVSSALLDTYKIYVTQLLESNVMELKLKLSNGDALTVHLLEDRGKRWRLFWEPDRGLE